MTTKACRDCGQPLPAEARGCPRCAMNVEAERMIRRVIAGVSIAIILVAGVGVLYFGWR